MAQESQKANDALEQKDQKFIKEFSELDKADALEKWERANRDRIIESSIYVRDAFDKHWKAITGNFYFSPITTRIVGPSAQAGATHPKFTNYRVKRLFTQIRWHKTVHEIPTKAGQVRKVVSFDVYGTLESGKEIVIERTIDTNVMASFMPEEVVNKIKLAAQKAGNFDGIVELSPPQEISIIGYWEVLFSPQGSPDDPKDVSLNLNGNCLQIMRNEKVVLPGSYLEIADHAIYPKFLQSPDQTAGQRKIVAWVQVFPYTVIQEATAEEYLAKKREGDRITKEARRREMEVT